MKNFCSLIALFAAAVSQGAFAHTTISDAGTEGKSLRTIINIPHGCGLPEDSTELKPNRGVVAMSVVFPNAADSTTTRDDTGEATTLSGIIAGANDHNGGLVAISPRVVQDKSTFEEIKPVRDANRNVHGIHYTDGFLDPELTAEIPIQFSAFGAFVSTSCAKKITARVGIANYCSTGVGPRRADIWIGHTTNVFNDPNIVSVDFWPVLVINRDLVKNPLDPACGEGFSVTTEPSAADIDATLPIENEGFQPSDTTP